MILGFSAILLVGITAIFVLKVMKASEAKATISTVDNTFRTR